MHVEQEQVPAGLVCHLVGNLEQHTAADFREAVAALPGAVRVVFELSAVPFIDSAGLGALIGAVRRLRESGGEVVVCSPRPSVNRVLQLVGLPRVVPVLATLGQATEHLSRAAVA